MARALHQLSPMSVVFNHPRLAVLVLCASCYRAIIADATAAIICGCFVCSLIDSEERRKFAGLHSLNPSKRQARRGCFTF